MICCKWRLEVSYERRGDVNLIVNIFDAFEKHQHVFLPRGGTRHELWAKQKSCNKIDGGIMRPRPGLRNNVEHHQGHT